MNRKRVVTGIEFVIEIALVLIVGLIITVSLLSPRDNLFSWQMCIGTICFFVAITSAYLIWTKNLVYKAGKWNDILFIVGITVYVIVLYVINIKGRNSANSLVDYFYVYSVAEEMATGKCSDLWNYFYTYPNNFKTTMYLSVLFFFAKNYLGMQDPYAFVLFLGVMQVVLAIIATRYLSGRTKEERKINQCPILAFFVCLLPIIGTVQSFYTDSMSFCFTVVVIALLVYAVENYENKKKCKTILSSLGGGVMLALGITIKVTILISFIAGIIIVALYYRKKSLAYVVTIALIIVMCMYGIIAVKANSYEIYRQSHETANPISSWVALGLKGDGSYYGNRDFAQAIVVMSTKEEKKEYTKQYILDNINYAWNLDHLYQKLRYNYASGNLGLKDATYYAYVGNENNIIWELFAPYGKYYWRTSQINFSYVFGIWVIYFVGGIVSIVSIIKGKVISKRQLWIDLSVIGIFLFLMIWEANNRQLYNQMPIIFLGAMYHLNHFKEIMFIKNTK